MEKEPYKFKSPKIPTPIAERFEEKCRTTGTEERRLASLAYYLITKCSNVELAHLLDEVVAWMGDDTPADWAVPAPDTPVPPVPETGKISADGASQRAPVTRRRRGTQ